MKFKSLKTRTLIWFALIISILLIIFNLVFLDLFDKNIEKSIESELYSVAFEIEEKIEEGKDLNLILSNPKTSHLNIAIIKDGKIIHKTNNFEIKNINKYLNTEAYISFSIVEKEDSSSAIFSLNFKYKYNGTIILKQDNIHDKEEKLIDIILLLNPILLFLMIFFASRLIDKILLPIKEITNTAKKININAISNKIKQPKYNDELKELIDTFNNMTIRLQNGFEQIEKFNSDVSHELKTPLTVIKGEISLSLRKTRKPIEYQQSLKTISYEVNNMQEMIDNLLLLVQYSKENIKQTFSLVDLDSILIMVLEKYNPILKEKNIKIHLDKFQAIKYNANSQLISIIFSNIIDNAIKYIANNKNIYISLFKDTTINFIVKDKGIGISEEDLSKITDRFYRVNQSRNKDIKGFGLGLSIVKNSVELHDAKISISSQLNKGTEVKIEF